MVDILTAKDLLKNKGIITCSPSCSLSEALALLQSSHDAVFVVETENKLLGVINPYYVLFQSNLPPATKVKNCLFSPPKLKESTPLSEIARNMMESKVYYLPVFSQEGSWIGIVSIRRLLRTVVEDIGYVEELEITRKTNIVTIRDNANLGKARALLSNKGVSRLPVINDTHRLVGILTRFDLRTAFAEPKSSQRFLSRSGEKRKLINKPIRGFYKKTVVTATDKTSLSQMLQMMLDKEIGSIVMVNSKWQPIDILSYRDLLKAIAIKSKGKKTSLSIYSPDDFNEKEQFRIMLRLLIKKVQKINGIDRVEAHLETVKNPVDKARLYEITLKVIYQKSKSIIGSSKDYSWKTALSKAIKRIKKQTRRAN